MPDYENPDEAIKKNKNQMVIPDEWEEIKFVYDKILQVRDLDNKLMWTRISLMLAIQGLLISFLINAYAVLFQSHFLILLLSLCLGLYLSIIFLKIVQSSSFWVDWWQDKLKNIEKKRGNFDIFLTDAKTHPNYVSSRQTMIHIAQVFCLAWTAIVIITIMNRTGILQIPGFF